VTYSFFHAIKSEDDKTTLYRQGDRFWVAKTPVTSGCDPLILRASLGFLDWF